MVYGSSLAAYSTVQSLLSSGLPPSRLTLVQPQTAQCFNNPTVEEKVGVALRESGVTVHTGLQLEGFTSDEEGEGLSGVQLVGEDEHQLTLECKVRTLGSSTHVSW